MTIVYDMNDFATRGTARSCESCGPSGSSSPSDQQILRPGPYAELYAGKDPNPHRLGDLMAMLRGPVPGDADYVVPSAGVRPATVQAGTTTEAEPVLAAESGVSGGVIFGLFALAATALYFGTR